MTVKASIVVEWDVVPQRVNFGQHKVDEPVKQTVRITSDRLDTLKIEKVELDPKLFDYKILDKMNNGERTLELEMILKAGTQQVGRHNHRLVIHTNSKKMPTNDIWMSDEVVGNISVQPVSVNFYNFEPGNIQTQFVIVTKTEPPYDLEISDAKVNNEFFDLNLEVVEKGKQYRLAVTLSDKARGRVHDMINLTTNDEQQPTITIRAYGFEQRQPQHAAHQKPVQPKEHKTETEEKKHVDKKMMAKPQ